MLNGFTRPLSILQISSWVIQFSNITISTILFIKSPSLIIAFCVVSALELIVLVSGYSITKSSPFCTSQDCPEGSALLFCVDCNRNVSVSCKHCLYCNNCVVGFDHHCKLINNCIGKKNYKQFVALLCSLNLLEIGRIVYFAIASSLFVDQDDQFLMIILSLFQVFLHSVILVLSAYLLAFHMYLLYKGLNSYQYTIRKVQPRFEIE